jgi:ABC-type phosphate transport system substrate-binding protein
MKRMLWTRAIVPLAAGIAVAASATPAHAVNCTDPSLPNPVFITGSSAVQNLLAPLGAALAGTTTIVYASPGSCQGVDAMFNGTPLGTGTALTWSGTTAAPVANTCTLNNEAADIGVSDVYYSSCRNFTFPSIPAGIGEFFGPHQVMNFVVPAASSQTLISAQAAYFIYGFKGSGGVTPWANADNMNSLIFQRGDSSGTQAMIAVAINVSADKWIGTTTTGGSNGMLAAVAAALPADAAIGVLASDVADVSRSKVTQLAYQHYDQDCAWLPDSSSTAIDKKNVRDGHYPLWGPIHFYTKVDTNKMPTNTLAANLIGYFDGSVAPPTGPFPDGFQDFLKLEIGGHVVPQCAMKVQRSTEIGPMSSYAPPIPCGCFFDSLTATTSCAACTADTQCTTAGATKCRYGYCEAN